MGGVKLSEEQFNRLMNESSSRVSKDSYIQPEPVKEKDPILEQLEMLNFSIKEMSKLGIGNAMLLEGIGIVSKQLSEIKIILNTPKKYVMDVERNQEKLIKSVEIIESYGSV